jgi:hypothetical protein
VVYGPAHNVFQFLLIQARRVKLFEVCCVSRKCRATVRSEKVFACALVGMAVFGFRRCFKARSSCENAHTEILCGKKLILLSLWNSDSSK